MAPASALFCIATALAIFAGSYSEDPPLRSYHDRSQKSRARKRCRMPADSGPCSAVCTRYYYDSSDRKCKTFNYGGCLGNANRFVSLHQCKRACKARPENRCEMPPDTGPCKTYFTKYYHDSSDGMCKTFTYGGCRGNENRFDDRIQCETACKVKVINRCELEPDPGPCDTFSMMFYYDSSQGKCKEFSYGGCPGNENRFAYIDECERACKEIPLNRCEMPPDKGPCRTYFTKYYYDTSDDMCKTFTYGGCLGNENRFDDRIQCETACKGKAKDRCQMKLDTGPCRRFSIMFYYDSSYGKCEAFLYGGCHGNENRFASIDECEGSCRGHTKCPRNETFKVRVSSSCGEFECGEPEPATCSYDHVSRCFCKSGYYRVGKGPCVRVWDCPGPEPR